VVDTHNVESGCRASMKAADCCRCLAWSHINGDGLERLSIYNIRLNPGWHCYNLLTKYDCEYTTQLSLLNNHSLSSNSTCHRYTI
jgi:hypothetical protein